MSTGWDKPEASSRPDQLRVTDVDFQLERNRELHHTSQYETKNLFVRRGQAFELNVTFSKVPKTEMFVLEFTVRGVRRAPSINKGTVIRIPFHRSHAESAGAWGVQVRGVEGTRYDLLVHSPPDAIVSRYNVAVIVKDSKDAEPNFFKQEDPIYMLFNPWCREDTVYMEGDIEKDEYVLNDSGYVFTGSARPGNQYARPWIFGQFEDVTSDVVFDLLEKCVNEKARWDPISVSRSFTHLINFAPTSNEETKVGVLIGNWSGDYEGGEKPSFWTGSTKIYETFAKSGGKPVKYGQCWVFSGVLCTAMRCLGIPCRSVTNFASAHDTDFSMTIDTVYDSETFEENEELSGDSVWNFHVWDEVYFSRPDLPGGMGGWQVIDATPQEFSQGTDIYQMGPAPVTAIKQGQTFLSYDTKFAFAEVNADRITWLEYKNKNEPDKSDMKIISMKKNAVGKFISTTRLPFKRGEPLPRFLAREDITLQYKYPEGSDEERHAVEEAVKYGCRPDTYEDDKKVDDVEIEILLEEKLPIGHDVTVKVAIKNKSSAPRNVAMTLNPSMCYYTGVLKSKMEPKKKELTVPPGESTHVLAVITAGEYSPILVDLACIRFIVFGKVQETSQQILTTDSALLTPPEMKTEIKIVDYQVEVQTEFVNPLPIALTNCTCNFEGARLLRSITLFPNDVQSEGSFKQRFRFTPREKGKKTLVVDFDSNQIGNISDVIEVDIPY